MHTVPVRRNLTGNTNANGYENGNGTGIELIQNRYRTDIEWIWNGDGSQKL